MDINGPDSGLPLTTIKIGHFFGIYDREIYETQKQWIDRLKKTKSFYDLAKLYNVKLNEIKSFLIEKNIKEIEDNNQWVADNAEVIRKREAYGCI